MTHLNYLKCKDGVPVIPHEWTLDNSLLLPEEGVTWEPFDTDVIYPNSIKDTLVGGKVVQDQSKRDAYETEQSKANIRSTALRSARESAVDKPNWGALSMAERKIAVGLIPTDEELGI